MNRAEKEKIVAGIKEKADSATIAVITDFKGIKVEEIAPLRTKLREQGVHYQVVKNSLAKIAFEQTDHKDLSDSFKECCAVAFGSDDPVVAAKVLVEYAKKNKKFSVKGGSLEGKVLTADDLKNLSELPSKEQLLAKTLGTMNAVPTNFVCLFANMIRNMLYAFNAIKEQKEQG